MTLEESIIEIGLNQNVKMAQLYQPAIICRKDPTTGLDIKNKTVEFVIRDCALISTLYLPIEIFGRIEDPIKLLKGKVNSTELKVFAQEVSSGKHICKRVLYNMIFDYTDLSETKTHKSSISDNVYGDYGNLVNNNNTPTTRIRTYEFACVVSVLEGILL